MTSVKAILPALMPILIVCGLVAVLVASSNFSNSLNPQVLPSTEPSPIYQPNIPSIADTVDSIPEALPVNPDELALSGSYPASQYRFVEQSYSWKRKGGKRNSIRFNPDGSVTQNFHHSSLRWRPNNQYSLIMSSDSGWFVDVVFDAEYRKITGRPHGEKTVYVGKSSR